MHAQADAQQNWLECKIKFVCVCVCPSSEIRHRCWWNHRTDRRKTYNYLLVCRVACVWIRIHLHTVHRNFKLFANGHTISHPSYCRLLCAACRVSVEDTQAWCRCTYLLAICASHSKLPFKRLCNASESFTAATAAARWFLKCWICACTRFCVKSLANCYCISNGNGNGTPCVPFQKRDWLHFVLIETSWNGICARAHCTAHTPGEATWHFLASLACSNALRGGLSMTLMCLMRV